MFPLVPLLHRSATVAHPQVAVRDARWTRKSAWGALGWLFSWGAGLLAASRANQATTFRIRGLSVEVACVAFRSENDDSVLRRLTLADPEAASECRDSGALERSSRRLRVEIQRTCDGWAGLESACLAGDRRFRWHAPNQRSPDGSSPQIVGATSHDCRGCCRNRCVALRAMASGGRCSFHRIDWDRAPRSSRRFRRGRGDLTIGASQPAVIVMQEHPRKPDPFSPRIPSWPQDPFPSGSEFVLPPRAPMRISAIGRAG